MGKMVQNTVYLTLLITWTTQFPVKLSVLIKHQNQLRIGYCEPSSQEKLYEGTFKNTRLL